MENNDDNSLLNVNSEEAETENSYSDEPKIQLNEQEENDQIIRFEEDLASYYLDRMAIIL
jgi:hypothetical protein